MITIQTSKSTGKTFHVDENKKVTEITGLPPQASLKAILIRIKAMGLKEK